MTISAGAISADSATDVWVVGFLATSSTTSLNVSLHWNGISWTQNLISHVRFGVVGPVGALSLSDVWGVGARQRHDGLLQHRAGRDAIGQRGFGGEG